MLNPDIPFSFTRLHKRLPLHDASRIAYAKSKFNWMSCDFTEEFFDNTEPCFCLRIIDKIFNNIAILERRFEINTVDKLVEQVACVYLETNSPLSCTSTNTYRAGSKVFPKELNHFRNNHIHILRFPISLYMSTSIDNKKLFTFRIGCLCKCFICHIFCIGFASCHH